MMAPAHPSQLKEPHNNNYINIVLMLLVGLLALWLTLLPVDVPYNADSANYIDQARSLLKGNGFETRPYGLSKLDITTEPDKLFPPGYPLLIAAGSVISGLSVETAAIWVNRIALIFLPLTVFMAFRSMIGVYGAACLGVLVGISPGVLNFGQYALTDILALTLILISFGLTLAAWLPNLAGRILVPAFAGGMVAGFAYLTRNASLAFLLAIPISMGLWFFISQSMDERARTWRAGLSWALGASIVVLPWLIRNMLVFGEIQPYEMEPSTINAWVNLRTFISAQIYEVIGSPVLGRLIGWSTLGLAILLSMVMVFLYLAYRYWPTLQRTEQRAFVFSITYAILGAAVVIAARSKYEWGEQISERHTLQFGLFLLLPTTILLRRLLANRSALITLSTLIMVTLVALRLDSLISTANEPSQKNLRAFYKLGAAELIVKSRNDETGPCASDHKPLVISNYAYLYRILCDANARHIMRTSEAAQTFPETMAFVKSIVGKSPVFVVFYRGKDLQPAHMPLVAGDLYALADQGWEVRKNSRLELVLVRNDDARRNLQ